MQRWSERAAALLKESREELLVIRVLLTIVLTLLCKAQDCRTPSEIMAIPGTAQLPCAFQLILGLETIADGTTTKESQEPLQQTLRILSGEGQQPEKDVVGSVLAWWTEDNSANLN